MMKYRLKREVKNSKKDDVDTINERTTTEGKFMPCKFWAEILETVYEYVQTKV